MSCGDHLITTRSRSSFGSDLRIFSLFSVSTITVATTRLRYHLWLAGTMYQGAHWALVVLSASSYASMYAEHILIMASIEDRDPPLGGRLLVHAPEKIVTQLFLCGRLETRDLHPEWID